jgi:D-3-phosphoglycerate dehydrogenase / 2-oxoglutarate reductase
LIPSLRIHIPDDAPPVLAVSGVWPELAARAELVYHDDLPGSEDSLIERIRDAELVLNIRSSTPFTARVFDACPHLRLLSVWGTGTDHVDAAAAARHGVTVTNTPGVSAASIAEHSLALLLAVARRIPQLDTSVRRGEWRRGESIELRGKTCGVVGLGAVGRGFARLAAALGMRVIAWTVHPRPVPGIELVELDEVYRTSDVISLHLRLSNETRGFLGAPQFAAMKRGVILINTARGAIVDETALLDALSREQIAGAGLDVFTTEPLPAGHPLTLLPNVVLTPHCAGNTPEALEAGLRMAVENIWAFTRSSGAPTHATSPYSPD